MLRQVRIEVNIVPQSQFNLHVVQVQPQLHTFAEPVMKDYTCAKSEFLSN